ncbi:hypothetical protein N8371_04005 [Vicingaceae bacterium]|nr:hypothetical protein [Vicingaceae bacterium]MDC1451560.1 hypothetical protein [Vicingaceae bacterium]
MFRILTSIIILFYSINAISQEFGGFRPSKQWNQIENENYRLIYSPEIKMTAKKVAAIFSRMNKMQVNIGAKRRNINIILQNSSTQANGYVGLAPFVSEFFFTPFPVNNAIGTLPWHYTLGVHEYQHVLQYANSYYGISKVLHWIGGELTWGAAQSLAIPNWFFEGDAVLAETRYSEQGRGRIPSFFNGYRAFVLEQNIPSYDKARNGSFQDFVPDHYRIGYLMVRYGRENYGENYWTKVLKNAASYKGIVYPFSKALKKEGGERSPKMYQSMMKDFASQWNADEINLGEPVFEVGKNEVSNYYYPKFDRDSTLYFIHGSYDNVSAFYKLENDKKVEIRQAGIRSNNYFDVYKGQILSTETHFDKRWGWLDYEDIVLYDVNTKKLKQLTTKGKYFHPSFSNDGEKILANYVNPNGTYEIHLIEKDGTLIQKIENPDQYYISEITSTSSNTFLANARDTIGKTAIIEIAESGEIQPKTKWTYQITGRPLENKGKIYFEASYNGIDNLFFLENGELVELTAEGSGKYSPAIDPATGQIYFTAFSLNGIQLRKAEIPDYSEAFKVVPELSTLFYYNPDFILNTSKIPTADTLKNGEISAYKNTNSLINLHSWTPTVSQTELGFELTSENVLNTLDVDAGWKYNLNEEKSSFDFAAKYGQYFVQINAFFQNTERIINRNNRNISFSQSRAGLGFSIPLNYSSKTYSRNLQLSSDYSFIKMKSKSNKLGNQDFHTLTNGFTYRQNKLKARKNIFPKLALSTTVEDSRSVNQTNYQFITKNALALPGLFKNDNLVIEADLRFEGGETNYRNSDQFIYSRGFRSYRSSEIYKLSSNYHFPIAYPDKGAFGIFYLLRIRGNAFFDYSIATTQDREFNSAGFELIFDTKLLRLLSVPVGVRYSYALSQKTSSRLIWEVFLPVSRF